MVLGRIFYGTLIAVMLGMFTWLTRGRILEASPFLVTGAVYAFLVYRVVSHSARAAIVMQWTFLLNYFALITVDLADLLSIPAAGPWFIGFIVGAIAAGHDWSGRRAGAKSWKARKRTLRDDGTYDGGRRLALINGICAVALLGMGTAQLLLIGPTVPAVAILGVAAAAGWALFRFPPPLGIRNGLLLVIPAVYLALGFIAGATGQMALPHSWAFGVLAGILIGGRYWFGSKLGEPRPPYYIPGQRRRRRKGRPRAKQAQTQDKQAQASTPARP